MSAVATASWYHCSIDPMSRSTGRSAVAAAASFMTTISTKRSDLTSMRTAYECRRHRELVSLFHRPDESQHRPLRCGGSGIIYDHDFDKAFRSDLNEDRL